MEIIAEEWRSVKGYEGYYEVSSLGRVRSVARDTYDRNGRKVHWRGRILKPVLNVNFYMQVNLKRNGGHLTRSVHRLVAMAFLVPHKDKPEVNHLDGNKTNNKLTNLEFVSHQGNMDHALKCGLIKKNAAAKLTSNDVLEIRNALREPGVTQSQIASRFGVTQSTISLLRNGRTWQSC